MLFFDIETDGLLDEVTKLHCIVIYDPQKDGYLRFDPISNPIQEGLKLLSEADLIIGHNIIGYDLPAIKKLHPWFSHSRVLDTMIWARLIAPDIEDYDYPRWKAGTLPGGLIGSHSLKAWGYRFGVLKGAFAETTDWQEWSVQMTDYCQQDVLVTRALHDKLKTKYVSQEALELEHKVAEIIQRQHQHGVMFDLDKAEKLYLELRKKREELHKELANVFEPWFEPVKKNEVFVPKTNNARMGYIKGAACCKIKLVKFNPASNKHIAYNFIKKYGWEPTEFTEKSKEPQINEDILKALPYPEAPKLAEFWTLNKRCSQIAEGDQAWLKTYNPNTGRIHGSINTIGAVTRRMTHFKPNTAQVPASYSPYGEECRSCFIVPRGYKMVGCDAEGLEARALGHFLALYDNGEYAKAVVEGKKEEGTDVHTVNWRALGKICKDRDTAKTFFYA